MKSLPMMDLWGVNHYQVFRRRNDDTGKLDIYMYVVGICVACIYSVWYVYI